MSITKTTAILNFLASVDAGCDLGTIAKAIGISSHAAHDVVSGMIKTGAIIRIGSRNNYIHKINVAYKSPMQIYNERVSVLHEALKQHKRLTRPEILILLSLKESSARTFIQNAIRKGDLYREGKKGYFLNEHDYHEYDENQAREKLKKKAQQEKKWRERRKQRALSEADNNPQSVNTIFDECRKYWAGYRWHKVFGSGARA